MKAINLGDNTYDIFDDAMKVYSELPVQSYVVRCSKTRGFFLEKYNDMEIRESKIYGVHNEKIAKVMNMFSSSDRNLGVILSGAKGIGKSLFAKMLANTAIQKGIPVIVVDKYVPGIASYIEEIEQEVMVLFDEFDKTFGEVKSKDGEASPQTDLLTLFDGLSDGKKLFVITCNELRKLNDYLINRPGRFHYHFRFEYPSAAEVEVYLKDKLKEDFYPEINNVISFANRVSLNYDCLRAVATELNTGIKFSEAIKDLNIVNTERQQYNVSLIYNNGTVFKSRNASLDMFSSDVESVYMYDKRGGNVVDIKFNPCDAFYDEKKSAHIITPENLLISYCYDDEYEDEREKKASLEKAGIKYAVITRKMPKGIHYAV